MDPARSHIPAPTPDPGLAPVDPADTADRHLMGTDVRVVVTGGVPSAELVLDRIAQLERRWSRFDPGTELSFVGRAGGRPVVVSTETAELVARSAYAWERTDGLFDPTVADALVAAGYDRDFDELVTDELVTAAPTAGAGPAPDPAPGMSGVLVDVSTGMVRFPPQVRVDPGGIGKGLAADIAAAESLGAGARGVLVSVGGDLRADGEVPDGGWEIEVDHLVGPPMRLNLHTGAVATSSVLRRRWGAGSGRAHHVIDPRTGRPSDGPAVSVSVLASEAWWAEAVATALLVGFGDPDHREFLAGLVGDGGAVVTTRDGTRHHLGPQGGAFVPVPVADPTGAGHTGATVDVDGSLRQDGKAADAHRDPSIPMEDPR